MAEDLELKVRLVGDAASLQSAAKDGAQAIHTVTTAADAEAGAFKGLTAEVAQLQAANKALRSDLQALTSTHTELTSRTASLESQLQRARAPMSNLGVSAGQTAAAMRMLPTQLTDVATSIAGGIPIWMVAIQQGGQIKDSFGGVGPMFRGLAAAITPTVAVVGSLAAVVGALVAAYRLGSDEADDYRKALLLTGNAAGTSVGQMAALASSIDEVVGTTHQAADALAQLAATGRVSTSSMETLAIAAVRMDRELGRSVAETVKDFEALGKAPLQASVKLNETYHYLTASVYDQIAALEKQGRTTEAAKLAQETFANSLSQRAVQMEANLGSIERGWRSIKDAILEVGDAMLGIGRINSVQDQLKAIDKQLSQIDPNDARPLMSGQRQRLLAQREGLANTMNRDALRAAEASTSQRGADDYIRQQEELVKTAAARKAAAAAEAQRVQDATQRAQLDALRSNLQSMTSAYSDAEKILDAQRAAGAISEAQYWEAKRAFIRLNADAELKALADENAALAAQKASAADRIANQSQIAQNAAQMAQVRAKAAADIAIANAQEAASTEALTRANREYLQTLEAAAAARETRQGRELQDLGRGDSQRQLSGRLNAADDRYVQQLRDLEKDRTKIGEASYQERLAQLNAFHQAELNDEISHQAAMVQAQQDGSLGMTRALENYVDNARNVSKQTEELFNNAFQGMENALVQFAQTGKLSFTDLANSIIADLIRIYIRQQMVGFLTTAASALFGGPSAAGVNASAGTASIPATVAHGGGVIGVDSFAQRQVPMSAFNGAPRFHQGLKSDEYYAVLQRGESVLTPAQMREVGGRGGSSVTVNLPAINVINQTGTPVQAQGRQRADGGMDVIIMAMKAAVADDVANGTGDMTRALESRYGLRPSFSSN